MLPGCSLVWFFAASTVGIFIYLFSFGNDHGNCPPGVVRASAVTRHRIVSGWLLQVVSVQIHSFKQPPPAKKKKKKSMESCRCTIFQVQHRRASLGRFWWAVHQAVTNPRTGTRREGRAGGFGRREGRGRVRPLIRILMFLQYVASVWPEQLKPAVDITCRVTLIWRVKQNWSSGFVCVSNDWVSNDWFPLALWICRYLRGSK